VDIQLSAGGCKPPARMITSRDYSTEMERIEMSKESKKTRVAEQVFEATGGLEELVSDPGNPQDKYYDELTNISEQKTTAGGGSNRNVHFSTKRTVWETPQDLFRILDDRFHFSTDVCAIEENAKCTHYYSPEVDGLAQTWTGTCFMNPPYGRKIGEWVEKALQSAQGGAVVVCLLPARTDTRWWHDFVIRAAHIVFLRGRLKFGGSKTSAPFPSVIVIFAPEGTALPTVCNSILGGKYRGWVVKTS